MNDITALAQRMKAAAEKATPGNYVVGHNDINRHGLLSSVFVCQEYKGIAGGVVAECHMNCLTKNDEQVYANAEFFAVTHPANVLALVEAMEKAQRANAAQDDHINQQHDRIDTLEKRNAELGKYAGELESRTVTAPQSDYFASLVAMARVSADKAMRKFPQPNYVLLKVAEEAGEVVQAGVHYAEKRMEWEQVEGEIVQLLAMLIRLVTEGDQINGITPPTDGIQVIEGYA